MPLWGRTDWCRRIPVSPCRRIAQRVLCRGRCGSFRGKRSDQAPAFCQGAPEPSQYGEFSSSFIG
jgi:hypothetical protein